MSHEIKIVSAYNGRLHESTIRRAEVLIGIEVDGKVVYFNKTQAKNYGVKAENDPKTKRGGRCQNTSVKHVEQ